MQDVTLFHIWPSLCSQKVRLALDEKGVAYQGRLVNIGPAMENYEPWYVRMNPAAVVPTLKHGDTIVTDSARIMRYIDDTFAGSALMPEDPALRTDADALMQRIDALQIRTISYAPRRELLRAMLHRMVGFRVRRLQALRKKNPDLASAYDAKLRDVEDWQRGILDPTVIARARQEVGDVLTALDEALRRHEGPFVLGARYSLVDVMATVLVARVYMLGRPELVDALPALKTWYEAVRSRPSFTRAAVSERLDPRKMAPVVLPWLLPRLAGLALVVATVSFVLRCSEGLRAETEGHPC